MRWLIAATLALAAWWTVALGTLVPLRDATGDLQYLFVWPGGRVVVVATALGAAALGVAHLLLVGRVGRRAPDAYSDARTGRWLAPLSWLGLAAFGVAPAVPGVGDRGAVLAFLFFDLRWWWAAVLLMWTAARAWRVMSAGARVDHGGALTSVLRSDGARRRVAAVALFALVTGWAAATSPNMRFGGNLHGDEPKYIRYLELWYQGAGMDVSRKEKLSELPPDAGLSLFGNAAHLWRAIAVNAGALIEDLGGVARDPFGFRWNRATGGAGFLNGRHGGVYQIHQPGLSVLLFPGYVIDRSRSPLESGYQDEFPAKLTFTVGTVWLLHGGAAVLLFLLLSRVLSSQRAAWLASGLMAMSLPVGAFAFQIYPEIAAAVIVLAAMSYVLRGASTTGHLAALAAGIGIGGLLWLHPRFLLVSLILGGAATFATSSARRRTFVAAWLFTVWTVLAYCYHVTGSWLPTAFYDASSTDVAMDPAVVPGNAIGYLLNAFWGLAPHAPWVLAAVPGMVLLARSSRRQAALLAAVVLALWIPASGHSLTAAGTTPGRFLVAVVPLLMWPAALWVCTLWSHSLIRVGVVVASVLSVEAASTYLLHHVKAFGRLRATDASGWRANLAFPDVSDRLGAIGAADGAVLVAWLAVLAAMVWWTRRRPRDANVERRSMRFAVAGVLICLIGGATAVAAVRGQWTHADYVMDDVEAHNRAGAAMVSLDRCRVCFATGDAQVDWRWLPRTPSGAVNVDVHGDGRAGVVRIALAGDGARVAIGRAEVAWGDGSVDRAGIVGERVLRHSYAAPGDYVIDLVLEWLSGSRRERHAVQIR